VLLSQETKDGLLLYPILRKEIEIGYIGTGFGSLTCDLMIVCDQQLVDLQKSPGLLTFLAD
jgi:hypothetical protein